LNKFVYLAIQVTAIAGYINLLVYSVVMPVLC